MEITDFDFHTSGALYISASTIPWLYHALFPRFHDYRQSRCDCPYCGPNAALAPRWVRLQQPDARAYHCGMHTADVHVTLRDAILSCTLPCQKTRLEHPYHVSLLVLVNAEVVTLAVFRFRFLLVIYVRISYMAGQLWRAPAVGGCRWFCMQLYGHMWDIGTESMKIRGFYKNISSVYNNCTF